MKKTMTTLFCILITVPLMGVTNSISYVMTVKGQEITPYVQEITDLALTVYRDYPYLYEGTVEEYYPAIEHYTHSSDGIACLFFNNNQLVGAAIGMPMNEMRDKYKLPLVNARPEENFDQLFYLGELLLLKEYRGRGLGKQMYLDFENTVQESAYKKICFCKIDESEQDPSAPENYKPLDGFWISQGYEKCQDVTFEVSWQNISEDVPSEHLMIFWMKSL